MEQLFTLEDVAAATGLPLRALADGARARPPKFDHVRLAGKRWMTAAQVEKLIAQNTQRAAEPGSAAPARSEFDAMHERLLRRASRRK